MKKISLFALIALIGLSSLISGCGGEFARRADGTCVFLCGGGGTGGGTGGGGAAGA